METVTCARCGIEFGMPGDLLERRRMDGKEFFCPSGHASVFRPSANARLRAKVEKLESQLVLLKNQKDWYEGLYDQFRGELRETERELTTAKLRAAGYKSQWLRVKHELEDLTANNT